MARVRSDELIDVIGGTSRLEGRGQGSAWALRRGARVGRAFEACISGLSLMRWAIVLPSGRLFGRWGLLRRHRRAFELGVNGIIFDGQEGGLVPRSRVGLVWRTLLGETIGRSLAVVGGVSIRAMRGAVVVSLDRWAARRDLNLETTKRKIGSVRGSRLSEVGWVLDLMFVQKILAMKVPAATWKMAAVGLLLVIQLVSPQMFGARVGLLAGFAPVGTSAFESFGDATGLCEFGGSCRIFEIMKGRSPGAGHDSEKGCKLWPSLASRRYRLMLLSRPMGSERVNKMRG